MNNEQTMEKIKKLLVMQQCTGATKHEEITCFKKAFDLALVYDLKEVNLDAVSRHIYKLEHNIDTKIREFIVESNSFETEPDTEEYDFEDFGLDDFTYATFENYDFEYKPRLKNNLVKNITLGVIIGGLLAWMLKGSIKNIQENLAFIVLIVIPTIIILLTHYIKTFFSMIGF